MDPLHRAVAAIAAATDGPPGTCLAVSHGGEISVASAGVCQVFDDTGPLARPSPIGVDTPADLGSLTKAVATTAGLVSLLAAGELSLGQTLSSVLPFTAGQPAGAATLEQLLEHRAGLWEWWPLYLESDHGEQALRAAASRPLRYAPDDARHESDLGFQLLGAALAAAMGSSLGDAIGELVLAPLGLHATRYATPLEGTPVAASSIGDWIEHRMIEFGQPFPLTEEASRFPHWRSRVLVGEVNDGNAFHCYGSVAGHAGLFSTARDLLRFGDALRASLAGHGPLDRKTLSRCLTPGADPRQGLGFRRWPTAGGPAWGHTGFPGVGVAVLAELGATVALVTNRLHVEGAPRAIGSMWELSLRAACEHCAA